MQKSTNVDEYIANAPNEIQDRLRKIRGIIKAQVPDVEEKISYGMPYYGYKGRLVYFAYAKNHIGIYIPGSVIKDHEEDLKSYSTSTATIRFSLDKELPLGLITKLIKARATLNDRAEKKK